MAYSAWLYAVTGDPVVQRLLPLLVGAAVERVPGATVADRREGVAIASCYLSSADHSGSVLVQVATGPAKVKSEAQRRLDQGGPARLVDCDTIVELILVGDVDWDIVRAICRRATRQWSAILCDEASGFDAFLDDDG
jgi:hypothetical protein